MSAKPSWMQDIFRQRGFSLVEMMAVLVTISLMASLAAPSFGRAIDRLKFRREVRALAGVVRYARLTAVSRGGEVGLTISDDDGCKLLLTGVVEEERDCKLEPGDVLTLDPDAVAFFPEGVSTPAVMTLTRGERFKRIKIDLLTGLPEVQ